MEIYLLKMLKGMMNMGKVVSGKEYVRNLTK